MPRSTKDSSRNVTPYPALSRPVVISGRRRGLIDRAGRQPSLIRPLLIVLVVAAATVYLALSSYMALTLTRPARLPFERDPSQFALAFEEVTFPSRVDGLVLSGWLLPAAAGSPTRRPVVMVHGKASDRQREAKGRVLEIAQGLVRDGHAVLMLDLRGSGRSGGERFTLGAEEVRDVGGAVAFLKERGLAPRGVTLLGFSMGAATAMLFGATDPDVKAIAEDSGYADLVDVLEDQVPKASGLPPLFTPGVVLMARVVTGADPYSIRPVDSMQALASRGVPLLVIHGDKDTTVPAAHARRLATAYGPEVQTHYVPSAEHVGAYAADPAAYMSRLLAFFNSSE